MRRASVLDRFILSSLLTLGLLASNLVFGQAGDFPNKTIKFIVPFPSGSGTDLSARITAQSITEQTGQSVVIDNRAGASGFLAAQAVAQAPADGYTVLYTTNTTHAANASLFKKLPYDPVRDFEPVSLIGKSGLVLVVAPASPHANIADLMKFAVANPGKLNFGSGSSSTRVASEMFIHDLRTKALHVPYKGVPQALVDVMGKQIDFMISDIGPALPLIQQGKLRALAVTTAKRYPSLPDTPTLAESGLPGFELVAWAATFVPRDTPRPVIEKLNRLIRHGQTLPVSTDFYKKSGGEPSGGTPEDLAAFVRSETAKWAKAVKAAGIEPE